MSLDGDQLRTSFKSRRCKLSFLIGMASESLAKMKYYENGANSRWSQVLNNNIIADRRTSSNHFYFQQVSFASCSQFAVWLHFNYCWIEICMKHRVKCYQKRHQTNRSLLTCIHSIHWLKPTQQHLTVFLLPCWQQKNSFSVIIIIISLDFLFFLLWFHSEIVLLPVHVVNHFNGWYQHRQGRESETAHKLFLTMNRSQRMAFGCSGCQ